MVVVPVDMLVVVLVLDEQVVYELLVLHFLFAAAYQAVAPQALSVLCFSLCSYSHFLLCMTSGSLLVIFPYDHGCPLRFGGGLA